jgi:hypothetical protein
MHEREIHFLDYTTITVKKKKKKKRKEKKRKEKKKERKKKKRKRKKRRKKKEKKEQNKKKKRKKERKIKKIDKKRAIHFSMIQETYIKIELHGADVVSPYRRIAEEPMLPLAIQHYTLVHGKQIPNLADGPARHWKQITWK